MVHLLALQYVPLGRLKWHHPEIEMIVRRLDHELHFDLLLHKRRQ